MERQGWEPRCGFITPKIMQRKGELAFFKHQWKQRAWKCHYNLESFGCQTYTLTWIIWWVEFLSSVPTKKLMRTFFPYLEFSCAIAFSAVQEVPKGTEGEARFLKLCFISRTITWRLLISKGGTLSYRKFAPSFSMLLATRIYLVTVWVKVVRLCYQ